ncbi:MAG: hypothetical protein JNL40_01005 [Cyclobacteriaceae bacterium]|nr:hypothetical protein [Cyclobacteriaceae bacterium]
MRTYRMGFANSAPRFDDFNLVLQSLQIWTTRADAAIVNTEVPWDTLFSGTPAKDYVARHYAGLVDFYRSKNFKLWVYIDPQNGLDRANDALELVAMGKSIADPEAQALYRKFVLAMDSVLKPEHLGLALETNLIRAAASSAIYQGVKKAANDAAAELAGRGTTAKLSVSVQVDVAWGNLGGGGYVGVAQDFADFPFIEELGLSSYPYFGISSPDQLPDNYYSKLVESKSLPVFVSEGGWSSGSVSLAGTSFTSSPQLQAAYIKRQRALLDAAKAIAWFQLTFTDIDIASLTPPIPENLGYFIYLGLVDINLQPKPALSAWDEVFAVPLK